MHSHDPSNSAFSGRHIYENGSYKAVADKDFKAAAYPKYKHSLDLGYPRQTSNASRQRQRPRPAITAAPGQIHDVKQLGRASHMLAPWLGRPHFSQMMLGSRS